MTPRLPKNTRLKNSYRHVQMIGVVEHGVDLLSRQAELFTLDLCDNRSRNVPVPALLCSEQVPDFHRIALHEARSASRCSRLGQLQKDAPGIMETTKADPYGLHSCPDR